MCRARETAVPAIDTAAIWHCRAVGLSRHGHPKPTPPSTQQRPSSSGQMDRRKHSRSSTAIPSPSSSTTRRTSSPPLLSATAISTVRMPHGIVEQVARRRPCGRRADDLTVAAATRRSPPRSDGRLHLGQHDCVEIDLGVGERASLARARSTDRR